MFIDYESQFSNDCLEELFERQHGHDTYGPAKVYAIAQCETDGIKISEDMTLNRDEAAFIIIGFDCFIVFLVTIFVIRLTWYEQVSVLDMKNGKLRLEDFSV
mmetsp:Transcript_41633/g.63557  ORF Transcript_41633/g.63557 Transcript_41633/m.63557 type:complete len:102 (-) Transcript_41633:540-845(-)